MTVIEWLEQRNIIIRNMDLINQAFMHSSYVNEHRSKHDNERLEFMGDAVLQLWISDKIFRIEPPLDEGHMTTLRAQLVCEKALAIYAKELKLNDFLLLGSGEEKSGGRERDSIVSDMFEAFLGALYMDSGMETIDNILDEVITPRLQDPNQVIVMDYKTKLQEFVQSDTRKTVTYEVVRVTGPSNNPKFDIQVKLDEIVLGRGSGNSKKKAEQMAAKDAFEKMVK
ncbi:MAG: ribonuclease III [Anaerorhabdus sp.]|uniref:ribonuclease III n=1 Tax=Anaerorhabdus sp. TaxID=1872524 RepID=UPI002B207936|nr:ribonuclease III [Anaerorhabdus sp.]MEA4874006.1 ribonuclease III [Anaerorhabdus sp.]